MDQLLSFVVILLFLHLPLQGQIKLVEFTQSECDEFCDLSRMQQRIAFQKYQGERLELNIGAVLNCAYENPIFIFSGDTLKLIMNGEEVTSSQSYLENAGIRQTEEVLTEHSTIVSEETIIENYAFCDCYFNLEYTFTGVKSMPVVITLNGEVMKFYEDMYKTYPVQYEIQDGDTINYRDKYGYSQGTYVETFRDWIIKGNKLNNNWTSFTNKANYSNGQPKGTITLSAGFYTATFWYENGNIMASRVDDAWQYYDLEGNIVDVQILENRGHKIRKTISEGWRLTIDPELEY